MSGKIVPIKIPPRLMECTNCDGDHFAISESGQIACWDCGGYCDNAKVEFTSTPTHEAQGAAGEG